MTRADVGWADRSCGISDEAAHDLDGQIRAQVDAGMGAIELRSVAGRAVADWDASDVDAIAEAVRAAALSVAVLDTPVGNWATTIATDEESERRTLIRCATAARALGCRYLRVMSYPNDGRPEPDWEAAVLARMERLTAEAQRQDVVLLHENCHGWAGRGATETVRLMREIDSPHLRLIFDMGNGLAYGYEPIDFLARVLPWVEHVHVKDGRRVRDDALFTTPGRGEADVAGCVRMLESAGYTGRYSIEPNLAHVPHLGQTARDEELTTGYRACATAFRDILTAVLQPEAGDGHTVSSVVEPDVVHG